MPDHAADSDEPVLTRLDAGALRQWCTAGLEALTACRQEIDDLNVYPVPDGDTGINLQLTMASVVEALHSAAPGMAATVEGLVRGSLMGARGNSGVILSQLLRGLGEVLSPLETCGPDELRTALTRSAQSAYAAVGTPVEGTLLTVAREAAEAAAGTTGDLADLVRTASAAAAASLARTPQLLSQLRDAGVVDAGGRGWCVLLEALEAVVTGQAAAAPQLLVARDRSGLATARDGGSTEFGYEVQFLLAGAEPDAVEALKAQLLALGDSLVIVGGDGLHNVHVHVNDVGAAVEAGVQAGRPSRITVTRFADLLADRLTNQVADPRPDRLADQLADRLTNQVADPRPDRLADRRPDQSGPVLSEQPASRVVVAVAPGDGLAALFRRGGAQVVDGGPAANPSTAQLLAVVQRSGASEVVLLPNDGNVRAVALAAAEQARAAGLQVAVVPTRSVLQGLAALSVSDPDRSFDDDVATMAAAAGATRWAEVTTAVREAVTDAGPCRTGDVLGLVEGRVAVIGGDVEQVTHQLLHRMLHRGGELVTVVHGADLVDGARDRLSSYVSKAHPGVELVVLDGGQPHYPLLLGVE